jgi:hypothetical protein
MAHPPKTVVGTLLLLLVTTLQLGWVEGFQGIGSVRPFVPSTSSTTTQLYGMFDFKPFHGQGSGDSKSYLDEQWEAQQEILRARRGHLDKEHLKNKYAKGASPKDNPFAGKGGGATNSDTMWVDDSPRKAKKSPPSPKSGSGAAAGKPKMKAFWEN